MKVDKSGKQRNQISSYFNSVGQEEESQKLVEIEESIVLDGLKVGKRKRRNRKSLQISAIT